MEALASNMTTIDMTSKDGEKVKMTKDEMQRFRKCMDDPKFVSLWQDYAQEISDPANLKEQEEYLQQVEREANEKGDYSFTFIFPKPCFCVRINTKDSRFFLNICDDEKVDEPVEETTGDRQASSWQVPISLGKIRDADHGDKPCKVVDACFHPKATYLARSSDKFMVFLVEIAVENINHNYHAEKKEIPHALPTEFRRLTDVQSIGNPAAQTIRIKAVAGKEGELVVEPKKPKVPSPKAKDAFKDADAGFADRLAASMGNAEAKARLQRERDAEAARKAAEAAEAAAAAQREAEAEKARAAEFKRNLQAGFAGAGQKKDGKKMPEYTIVHQGDIGYQDCFNESHRPERKLPKSLRVTMALPQVAKATELDMSIEAEAISLACERHGIEGEIALPFQIDPDRAAAKFDKTKRVLTITLPVVPKQSAFEIAYTDEERARRAAFREEAARQAAEEAAVRAEEEAAAAAERAAEEAAEKAKKEEREAARRAVEARLERLAAEKKEADAAEKARREAELARKHEETLKKKMAALEKTKLTMAEQEEACRAEAESEHQKSLRKIKKEMEALKLAESMLHESRKKQQEMPFTNQYVLEMD